MNFKPSPDDEPKSLPQWQKRNRNHHGPWGRWLNCTESNARMLEGLHSWETRVIAAAPAPGSSNLSQERAKARREGYLMALSEGTAHNLVALLRRGLVQLDQWQKKYGEHQPQWLPPAGDVRWAQDVAEALDARAPAAAPAQVPISDEREAFETFAVDGNWPIAASETKHGHHYANKTTMAMWDGWQARALLAGPAASPPPMSKSMLKRMAHAPAVPSSWRTPGFDPATPTGRPRPTREQYGGMIAATLDDDFTIGPGAPVSQPLLQPVVASAWSDVLAERKRQMTVKGWTPEHDDHSAFELSAAAACYALGVPDSHTLQYSNGNEVWPWDFDQYKPKDQRFNLVRAAALILAEIERMDRAAAPTTLEGGE